MAHCPVIHPPFDPAAQKLAAQALREGWLMAYPTETAYALGGNGLDPRVSGLVYQLKGRDETKRMPLLIDGPAMLALLAQNIHPAAELLMERFWPGPLTLIFHAAQDLPPHLAPNTTLALRWTAHPACRELMRLGRAPLIGTSANLSGQPPCYRLEEVLALFGGRLALAVQDDPPRPEPPTTIVDTTTPRFRILREGAVSAAAIQMALFDPFPGQVPLE